MIQIVTNALQQARASGDTQTKQADESAENQSTFSSILRSQTKQAQAAKADQKNAADGQSDKNVSEEQSDTPATQQQQTYPTAIMFALGLQQVLPSQPTQATVQTSIAQGESQQLCSIDIDVGVLQSTELQTSQNNAISQQSANYNSNTTAVSTDYSVLATAGTAQPETTDDAAENLPQGNRYGQMRNVEASNVKVDMQSGADVQPKSTEQRSLNPLSELQTTASESVQKQSFDILQTVAGKMSELGSDDSESQTDNTDKNSITALGSSVLQMNTASETIKVSDASSEIAKPVVSQITQEIKANLSADNSEFTMRLSPKELGELTVKMTSKDGILTVELIAADPKTQHLLSERAGEIQTAIQSSQEKQIHVSCPAQQTDNQDLFKQSDSQSNQQRHHDQTAPQSEEETFASTESFLSMLQQMDLMAM